MKARELQNVLTRATQNIGAASEKLAAEAAAIPLGDTSRAKANHECALKIMGMVLAIDVLIETERELLGEMQCETKDTDAAPTARGN